MTRAAQACCADCGCGSHGGVSRPPPAGGGTPRGPLLPWRRKRRRPLGGGPQAALSRRGMGLSVPTAGLTGARAAACGRLSRPLPPAAGCGRGCRQPLGVAGRSQTPAAKTRPPRRPPQGRGGRRRRRAGVGTMAGHTFCVPRRRPHGAAEHGTTRNRRGPTIPREEWPTPIFAAYDGPKHRRARRPPQGRARRARGPARIRRPAKRRAERRRAGGRRSVVCGRPHAMLASASTL